MHRSTIAARLAETRQAGSRSLRLEADGALLEADFDAVESLAVALRALRVVGGPAIDEPARLRRIAESAASRVTYLAEPLAVVECDDAGATVQVRSAPPQQDESSVAYFELLVRPGELALNRYEKAPAAPRRVVAAPLVGETFVRLAADLAAAAQTK